METTENSENGDNGQNNNGPYSARHKGRGGMWMFVVIGTAAALGTAAFVGHAVASGKIDGWHRGGHFGGHGGPGGHRAEMLFRTFDTDKDGAITAVEVNAETDRRLKTNDADNDGALSLKEFEGVWLEVLRNKMVDSFQRMDEDGDGLITKAEIDEKTSWMLTFMDRNEDGQITRKEIRPRHRHDDDDDRYDDDD